MAKTNERWQKMRKHFFLEGPIQEGKSTLIRKIIKDYLPRVGGFSSQRILNDSGETVGFRLATAAEAMALTEKYSPGLSNVFLYFGGEKIKMAPEIFTDIAIKYLRESEGKELILLDEIGGIELLAPDFRQALYETLKSDIPCLGVFKLETSIRHMCDNAVVDRDCINYHLKLRADLTNRFSADIMRFERNYSEAAEKAMKLFLGSIFR